MYIIRSIIAHKFKLDNSYFLLPTDIRKACIKRHAFRYSSLVLRSRN